MLSAKNTIYENYKKLMKCINSAFRSFSTIYSNHKTFISALIFPVNHKYAPNSLLLKLEQDDRNSQNFFFALDKKRLDKEQSLRYLAFKITRGLS